MSAVPPAVIFVNNDLTPSVQDMLVRQLFIDIVVDGYTYDNHLDGYGNSIIHHENERILVVRSYEGLVDRSQADICLFVKNGLVNILKNKFGPHSATYPILNINYYELGLYGDNNSIL